jgi:hypothetical protein
MWCRVNFVRTDISEEHIASFFRVEQTSVLTRPTLRQIPEDGILHGRRFKNLKLKFKLKL